MYLDLSEMPSVFDRFWLWSVEKMNIASFKRKDHLGKKRQPLESSVRNLVDKETGNRPQGPIRLLTHLSYFGFRFNPVSFYYCFDKNDEKLEYIVAEVNNTPWGEQHCYVLDAKTCHSIVNTSTSEIQRYQVEKQFHVSPFMKMDIKYDWRLSIPGELLTVHMENHQDDEKIFDATMTLEKQELNSRNLSMALIRFPLVTMKVVIAIYYQALKLWLKKIPFVDHPKNEAPKSVKSV